MARDRTAARDFGALFAPRSVAVLGASGTPGKWGYALAEGALAGEHRVRQALEHDPRRVRRLRRGVDRLLGHRRRKPGQLGESSRVLERASERRPGGDDLGHQAVRKRLVCVDALAQQHHLLGARGAEEARDPRGAARAREDAEADLGEAELRGVVGDPEVGGERELEPAAEAVAVDRADRRLRERC